ncbi:RnfH family protein [Rhodanobacter sp. DHG33]|uniref:RnfH family protein n=1 Tax=Rhodanobacter sp. DHG33 TaxID=2775921 RepID=UPI0017861BD4|nr:RnfH family protein [Rhodanobacter sp. DHG33]MBD8900425.1 RnfH family protein [Rhodanobacter sp. DHG33]
MAEPAITVEVMHAGTQRIWRCRVSLPAGSTAMQAVQAVEWLPQLPAEALDPLRLGIFSRRIDADQVLRDGDRVEIYRPLALDPMASRRRRAGQG